MAAEVAEDAPLHRSLEVLPVATFELGGLVESDSSVFGLREDPVEDDDVIVEPRG